MFISRTKDLKIFLDRPKIAFVYFFDDFCQEITDTIDSFFKDKYDLNKIYLKVKVSSSPKIIEELKKLGLTFEFALDNDGHYYAMAGIRKNILDSKN